MSFVRRYWGGAVVVLLVTVHAVVIGYVRNRISQLTQLESNAVEVARFRFQPVEDPSRVFEFRMHAIVEPSKLYTGRNLIEQRKLLIHEDAEQLLRQCEAGWLDDPAQIQIRERLMTVVLRHIDSPGLVERVLITDWLQTPVGGPSMTLLSQR